jgi:hypothetical protein
MEGQGGGEAQGVADQKKIMLLKTGRKFLALFLQPVVRKCTGHDAVLLKLCMMLQNIQKYLYSHDSIDVFSFNDLRLQGSI